MCSTKRLTYSPLKSKTRRLLSARAPRTAAGRPHRAKLLRALRTAFGRSASNLVK